MSENVIGPTIPNNSAYDKNALERQPETSSPSSSVEHNSAVIGPCLPPHMLKGVSRTMSREDAGCNAQDHTDIGPALPPHMIPTHNHSTDYTSKDIGPALPPHMTLITTCSADHKTISSDIGPALPPHMTSTNVTHIIEQNDDVIIGPLPPMSKDIFDSKTLIAKEIEKRASTMKEKLSGKSNEKVECEEWMTELPPVLQGFGMGPRKFRNKPINVGDRSVWTDTPADKLRKAKENKSGKSETFIEDVELQSNKIANAKVNNKACQSLLSMHQKERKRKIKEVMSEAGESTRRPFDREIDLEVNRFDNAAKKRAIKQSQDLSSRFSHGETSARFL